MKPSYKALLIGLSLTAPLIAHANDYNKVIELNAQVEFLASVDDYNAADGQAFLIRSTDDVRIPGVSTGSDRDWSIYTNSPSPVSVTFDLPAANKLGPASFLLHNTAAPGPRNEHRVEFYLDYLPCSGGAPQRIGGRSQGAVPFGGTFTLNQENASLSACARLPGSLIISNDAMAYRPYLGTYTANVNVTIADPGNEGGNSGSSGSLIILPPPDNGSGVSSIN